MTQQLFDFIRCLINAADYGLIIITYFHAFKFCKSKFLYFSFPALPVQETVYLSTKVYLKFSLWDDNRWSVSVITIIIKSYLVFALLLFLAVSTESNRGAKSRRKGRGKLKISTNCNFEPSKSNKKSTIKTCKERGLFDNYKHLKNVQAFSWRGLKIRVYSEHRKIYWNKFHCPISKTQAYRSEKLFGAIFDL